MAVFGIGFGMTYPTLNTQVAAMYPVQERGRAYGILASCFLHAGRRHRTTIDRLVDRVHLDDVHFRGLRGRVVGGVVVPVLLPPSDGRGTAARTGPAGGRLTLVCR